MRLVPEIYYAGKRVVVIDWLLYLRANIGSDLKELAS